MKKSRGLYATLTKNFLLIAVSIIAAFIATIIFMGIVFTFSLENQDKRTPSIYAEDVVKPDFKNIDMKNINAAGGWVEIVQNNQVIYVKGNKKDNIYNYTSEELVSKITINSINLKNGEIHYSSTVFKASDGKKYTCLVKAPYKKSQEKSIPTLIEITLIQGIVLFVILLAIIIFIFSKITSKKITKPLKYIVSGMEKLSAGDYSVRLRYKAEKEITQIMETVNDMAEKLQKAKIQKKKIEESKKKMIVDVSHDLKTPITTIQGYAKALSEGIVEDELKKKRYLEFIYNKSIRVTKLIDDLFRFSKLDCNNYELVKQDYDFCEFVREMVAEHYGEIEQKKFELNLNIPETEIIFNFDKKEMFRVLSNIFINTIKYNPTGTTLSVNLEQKYNKIVLKIGDNGVGIESGLKESIFDEFVRGDTARKSDGGSGLGLAIAKKIVERHQGTIKIESEVGVGTEFIITFDYRSEALKG